MTTTKVNPDLVSFHSNLDISSYTKKEAFQNIPSEIILHIFQFLPPSRLAIASLTCKEWCVHINDKQNRKILWVPWAKIFMCYLSVRTRFHKIKWETKIDEYLDTQVDGRSFFIRMSTIRRNLQESVKLIKDNSLVECNSDYENLIDIEFACSQLQMSSYEAFLNHSKNYLGALNELGYRDKRAFIDSRINVFFENTFT